MTKDEQRAWESKGYPNPVRAYRQHAVRAGRRGIDFKMTFAEWWGMWEPHYANRGVRTGQMCMCRTGDTGAYELGNVRIDTVTANAKENAHVQKAARIEENRTSSAGDWFSRGSRMMGMGYFKMMEIIEEKQEDEDFEWGY